MKLKAEINSEHLDVDLSRDGSTVNARVGDRDYTLTVSEPEPGVFLLKDGSSVYEASTSATAEGTLVTIGGREFKVQISDPKRLRGSSGGADAAAGRAEIKTAMPGKVVRILKAEGDAVEKGEGVIVVEAMKMQNEMRSPKDGVVANVSVAEGDTVAAGDVLVVIE
jgi:biotin carboxyl carrier protein